MEVMQPAGAKPAEPSPVPRARRHRLLRTLVVVVIVVAAGVSLYVLTRPPPIPLIVTEGSGTHTIAATFTDYTDTAYPVAREYVATTFANETGGPPSVLTLRLQTRGFNSGYWLQDGIVATVEGTFASNLHVSGLTLAYNVSGPAGVWGYTIPGVTNVSFRLDRPAFVDTHTGDTAFTPTLENTTGSGPLYHFLFPAYLEDDFAFGTNHAIGIRATVTGLFTPDVSVGILLRIQDIPTPAFSTAFYATVRPSSGGERWVLNVTDVDRGISNLTYGLEVLTLNGSVVVPETPLGGLWTSAVRTSIVYTPVLAGSGNVSHGDLITLPAPLYSWNYLVQILLDGRPVWAATLG